MSPFHTLVTFVCPTPAIALVLTVLLTILGADFGEASEELVKKVQEEIDPYPQSLLSKAAASQFGLFSQLSPKNCPNPFLIPKDGYGKVAQQASVYLQNAVKAA